MNTTEWPVWEFYHKKEAILFMPEPLRSVQYIALLS